MRFSVGVFPSFSSFSQTITCKKGVAPGLALFSLRPATLLYNGGASPGGRSSRPSHPFLPLLRHRPPIIPFSPPLPSDHSLHGIPTAVGGGSKGTALRPWHRPYRLSPFLLWSHGGRGGCDILGGPGPHLKLWGRSKTNSTTNMGGGVCYLYLGPCLAETFASSGHVALSISAANVGLVGYLGVFCSFVP